MGGGPGGYSAAIRLGQLGKSVVLVEKDKLGGVCLNRGCIPSKALIHAADRYHGLNDLGKMGIRLPQEGTTMDLGVWQDWKAGITSQLGQGIAHLCKENGVTVVKGQATFYLMTALGLKPMAILKPTSLNRQLLRRGPGLSFHPSLKSMENIYWIQHHLCS